MWLVPALIRSMKIEAIFWIQAVKLTEQLQESLTREYSIHEASPIDLNSSHGHLCGSFWMLSMLWYLSCSQLSSEVQSFHRICSKAAVRESQTLCSQLVLSLCMEI